MYVQNQNPLTLTNDPALRFPTQDPTYAENAGYLTPDALYAYCATRLSNLDSQVQKLMTQQQVVATEQQKIQAALQDIATINSSLKSDGTTGTDPNSCMKIEGDLESAISWMKANDPSNPQISALESLHDKVMATGSGPYTDTGGVLHGYYGDKPTEGQTNQDNCFGSDELKSFTDSLNTINGALNSSGELGMIQIQSLMSQRSTAIQLTTNILQSMGDGLSKIAGNVGH